MKYIICHKKKLRYNLFTFLLINILSIYLYINKNKLLSFLKKE